MRLRELYELDIIEARTKPAQNPKVSAYEKLLPYKDDPDIYITFTSLNKVGINPKSAFNTPNGVYTFPLALTWQMYEVDRYKDFTQYPDFVNGRPYIQVLKYTGAGRSLVISGNPNTSNYTDEDLEKDLAKLQKQYHLSDGAINREKDKAAEFQGYYDDTIPTQGPAAILWTVTRSIAYEKLRKRKDSRSGYDYQDDGKDPSTRVTNDWSSVFRGLGIQLVVDEFHSVIHEAEPCQAVFFSKKAFKHIDTALVTRKQENEPKIKSIDIDRVIDYTERNGIDEKIEQYLLKFSSIGDCAVYWHNVIGLQRWPGLETKILKDNDQTSFREYVGQVQERCPEIEPEILKRMPFSSNRYSYFYVRDNVTTPWPEAEPSMLESNNPELLIDYATNVLKKRWPAAEEKLVEWLHLDLLAGYYDQVSELIEYARRFGLTDWPALAQDILESNHTHKAQLAALYAARVMNQRWPEAEPIIKTNPEVWSQYAAKFPAALGIENTEDLSEFEKWREIFLRDGAAAINKLTPEQTTPAIMNALISTARTTTLLMSVNVLKLAYNNPEVAKVLLDAFHIIGRNYSPEDLQARILNAHKHAEQNK
jgi:hypothetical protein